MTTDERISADLAVVGRVSRERPIALDVTLRKVGALQTPAPRPSTPRAMDTTKALVLIRLVRVYANRVGRIYAGGAAVGCLLALLGYLALPLYDDGGPPTNELAMVIDFVINDLIYGSKLWSAMIVLAVVLTAHLVAERIASRRLETAIAAAPDPLALGRERVAAVNGWSLAGRIAGPTVFVMFFGMMFVTQGFDGLGRFRSHWDSDQTVVNTHTLVSTTLAMIAVVVGAVFVARTRRGPVRLLVMTGLGLTIATMIVGFRFDTGVGIVGYNADMPSLLLRSVLTVTGTAGLFMVSTGLALRQRAREEADLGN